jgi:hypothetical protein
LYNLNQEHLATKVIKVNVERLGPVVLEAQPGLRDHPENVDQQGQQGQQVRTVKTEQTGQDCPQVYSSS